MTELRINSKRRGVSPIIATLMLIAITVVGGILIFVFSQGFFNTNQVASSNAPDRVSVTSWNFTKSLGDVSAKTGLTDANGAQMWGIGTNATIPGSASSLNAFDWVVIQVKNSGNSPVPVTKVTINGIVYTPGTVPAGTTLTGAKTSVLPSTGSNACNAASNACFVVTSGNTPMGTSGGGQPTNQGSDTASASLETTPTIPAGKTVSIAVELNGKDFTPIKIGSSAIVQITTSSGNTILATATAGLSQ